MTNAPRSRPHAILATVLFIASAAACTRPEATSNASGSGGGRGRGGSGGPVPVSTATVTERDVPVDLDAIGNVEPYASVSIRSQVTGVVMDVRFHEGDFVKKGDLLFAIDPRPYQAQLEQARANLTRDQALVAQATAELARDRAQAQYAELSSQRNTELAERGIVSKDVAQQSQAAAVANAAAVAADEAAIDSAKAQLGAQLAAIDNAVVQLAYTTIRSPIDGRTGNLTMKPGNLVTANSMELTTIAQVEPVFVTFAVPAAHLPAIQHHAGNDPLSVSATSQEEGSQVISGALAFVDNAVDTSTDTIKLKARFDNADHRLWPGEFARVRLRLATLPHATVVASEAVQTGQDGQFVFVVKPDSTVEQRPVSVSQHIDDVVVIERGLRPGETIVTEGQLRLEPGSRVQSQEGGKGPARGGGAGNESRGRRGARTPS
jgi:multidrug efflux system membrane fusion protein